MKKLRPESFLILRVKSPNLEKHGCQDLAASVKSDKLLKCYLL